MTAKRWPSHAKARENGWFSTRHRTNAAHLAAQAAWRERQANKYGRAAS